MPPTDEQGFPLEEGVSCVRKFHKFWSFKHFSLPADYFVVEDHELTPKVLAVKRTLLKYVDSLEDVSMTDPKDSSGRKKI
ncbi:hypothetical protein A2U01_0064236, partial [Trifolium medium]|nr:hypothetical protein [Trifolium medium]